MKKSKLLIILGTLALALAPQAAHAHDNLGGDELAVAYWMLIGAMLVIVMGILAGIWAWRVGQFNNVESSKYSMLELSEDFDSVMAEADERERVERQAWNELKNRPKGGATRKISTAEGR